jgi:hypothetical protein
MKSDVYKHLEAFPDLIETINFLEFGVDENSRQNMQ